MTVVKVIVRVLAMLLVFLLGFLSCIGAIAGIGFYAYSKVSIDSINQLGFANIDTNKVINQEEAEISLDKLSIAELVAEFGELKKLEDSATIDYLIDRYGLILSPEIEGILNDDMREIPVFKLFSAEGFTMIMQAQTIGSILGFEKIENPDFTLTNGEKEFIWTDNGKEVLGVNAALADYSIYKLLSDGIDTESLASELTVAGVLNLTVRKDFPIYMKVGESEIKITDIEPISVWYDSNGPIKDKIMASVANTQFNNVTDTLFGLRISDFIGYVEYKGDYYSWNLASEGEERIILTLEDGITSEFADLTVDDVSNGKLDDKISEIELAKVLDYTLNDDGKYYDKNGDAVSGIMATLAGEKVGDIGESVGNIKVGEVAGYTYSEGIWYSSYDSTDPALNVKAEGILASLADLSVDEMTDEKIFGDKIKTVSVAEVLGYKYDPENEVYKDNGNPVTGVMGVIAGSSVNNIQETLDGTLMGDIIGYTKDSSYQVPVYDADGVTINGYETLYNWNDKNSNKVHVLMNKVANTKFENVGTLTDDLTISDIIEDRDTGFVSLLKADTKITDISFEINDLLNNTTIGELVDSKALDLKPEIMSALEPSKNHPLRDFKFPQLIDLVFEKSDVLFPTAP